METTKAGFKKAGWSNAFKPESTVLCPLIRPIIHNVVNLFAIETLLELSKTKSRPPSFNHPSPSTFQKLKFPKVQNVSGKFN